MQSQADITIYGGSAGSGKSFALILDPLRHYNNPNFNAVVFRRNATQVRNAGGLWQESQRIYTLLGAQPREISLDWKFPSGMMASFRHLEYDKTVYEYQGAQIPGLYFDELTHFTEEQFWYMLSRNRSTSGVPSYIKATTNPDADSWVRRLLDWWIGDDGYVIPERSGIVRWFVRLNNEIIWENTKEAFLLKNTPCPACNGSLECSEPPLNGHVPAEYRPKSLTFIAAKLSDNAILMRQDPSYIASLKALDRVQRARLLDGNWNTRPSSGNYFRREWFKIVEAVNAEYVQVIRYWDRAGTAPSETNKDPDYTVGLKLARLHTGIWIVLDVVRFRDTPLKVEQALLNTATRDGHLCPIGLEQDPGSAGVSDVENLIRKLAGYIPRVCKPTKDKITRAAPVSAQCEAGNVYLLKGKWNDSFLMELENFPPEGAGHDDQVDALSGAFNELAQNTSILDVL